MASGRTRGSGSQMESQPSRSAASAASTQRRGGVRAPRGGGQTAGGPGPRADDPAAGGAVEGYLTSGGTESLLQAVKTARDVGRERGMARPGIVAGESAHAAFTKAADYFDVDLIRVRVDADFRVSAKAMADA